MAGRNYIPHNALKPREVQVPLSRVPPHHALIEDPRLHHRHPRSAAASGRLHPALIEEHVAAQRREIHALLHDNQRLAASQIALKEDLAAAHQEIRHLVAASREVKAERDAEVREVYERSLKMEDEARNVDVHGEQVAQVRMEVQNLTAQNQELGAELQEVSTDLTRARADAQDVLEVMADIETMRKELQKGRAAIEYERKTYANHMELTQTMEKNMHSMACEIEKLNAELANAEKRARAAAAAAAAANPGPGYVSAYGNGDVAYGANQYTNLYGMHQAQANSDGAMYASGPIPHGLYDMQQAHVQR